MSELVLRLFFHGLIAFVPNSPLTDGPDQLTAYLVKDQDHYPYLAFEITPGSDCVEASLPGTSCEKEKGKEPLWCVCYLGSGVQISLEPEPRRASKYFRPRPPAEIPFKKEKEAETETETDAADLSWLVHMLNVDNRAAQAESHGSIMKECSARAWMTFGWESAQTCNLDQVDNKRTGKFRAYASVFPRADQKPGHQQALAEYAMFEVRLPVHPVKLVLSKGNKRIEHKLGCDSGKCPDVLIANALPNCYRHVSEAKAGEHFKMYYCVSKGEIENRYPIRSDKYLETNKEVFTCDNDPYRRRGKVLKDRLAPSEAFEYKNACCRPRPRDLFAVFDDLSVRGIQSRIICPMAVFEP